MTTQEQDFLIQTLKKEVEMEDLYPELNKSSFQERIEFILNTLDTPLNPLELNQPNPLLKKLNENENYHAETACRIFHLEIQRVNTLLKKSPELYNSCVDYIAGMIIDLQMEIKESFPIVAWAETTTNTEKPYSLIEKTENSYPPTNGRFISMDTKVNVILQSKLWKSTKHTRENVMHPNGLYWTHVKVSNFI